jgi:hypothetical protein
LSCVQGRVKPGWVLVRVKVPLVIEGAAVSRFDPRLVRVQRGRDHLGLPGAPISAVGCELDHGPRESFCPPLGEATDLEAEDRGSSRNREFLGKGAMTQIHGWNSEDARCQVCDKAPFHVVAEYDVRSMTQRLDEEKRIIEPAPKPRL